MRVVIVRHSGKLHESEVASSQYKRELDDMGAVREKLLAREMDINQLQCAKRSIMEEHEKSKCDLQRMRSELEELVLKIERERCDAKRFVCRVFVDYILRLKNLRHLLLKRFPSAS